MFLTLPFPNLRWIDVPPAEGAGWRRYNRRTAIDVPPVEGAGWRRYNHRTAIDVPPRPRRGHREGKGVLRLVALR